MYNAANMMEMLHDAPDYGFLAPVQGFDWKLLKDKRDACVVHLWLVLFVLSVTCVCAQVRGPAHGHLRDEHV
jgi:hypothetical protein